MSGAVSIILLGLLLGLQHATDPDHVVAVATIVSRRPRFSSGALLGALWGVGHTLTIVGVGGAIILLNLTITPRVGLSLELAVALMLIVLGMGRLVSHSRAEALHSHAHTHDGVTHEHLHLHPSQRLLQALQAVGARQGLRSVGIGVVHGLAGSAAIALLVLSTVRNPYWAVAYLLVFGAGTILGMMAITAALTLPFALTARRFAGLNRALALGSGAASLGLGLFLIYQIGFVGRLLIG